MASITIITYREVQVIENFVGVVLNSFCVANLFFPVVKITFIYLLHFFRKLIDGFKINVYIRSRIAEEITTAPMGLDPGFSILLFYYFPYNILRLIWFNKNLYKNQK